MLSVLLLFLIPVGGGIPAGVLLARDKGLIWPVAAGLYLISDILLALAFEPVLRLLAWIVGKVPFLARFRARMKAAMARSAGHVSGTGAGPISLVMISFGVDPMTGRASAMAAGHGFLMGWVFAIAGDMLYYAVIAVTTLHLNQYIRRSRHNDVDRSCSDARRSHDHPRFPQAADDPASAGSPMSGREFEKREDKRKTRNVGHDKTHPY